MGNDLIKENKNFYNLKSMKIAFNLSLFLFTLFIFGENSLSLTDYQIKKICKKHQRESSCLRNLREKRSNLQKGNLIEIPVIPHKR